MRRLRAVLFARRVVVERAVLLRRVVRAVLRDGLRRFAAVLRRAGDFCAVDLRVVDLRAVDLRAVDLRAVGLRAVDLRPADLRAVDLRVVVRDAVLRPVAFRPDVLRAAVLRPEDAAVLPVRSRRFVRARLRLFSVGLS